MTRKERLQAIASDCKNSAGLLRLDTASTDMLQSNLIELSLLVAKLAEQMIADEDPGK